MLKSPPLYTVNPLPELVDEIKLTLSKPPDPVNASASETVKDKVSEDISVLEKVKVVFTVLAIYFDFKN